jgi:hypothetical protein
MDKNPSWVGPVFENDRVNKSHLQAESKQRIGRIDRSRAPAFRRAIRVRIMVKHHDYRLYAYICTVSLFSNGLGFTNI